MTAPRNATPTPVQYGLNDVSGRQLVPTPSQYPTHLPLVFLMSERGDTEDAYSVIGDAAIRMYGSSTFNLTSKYTTHQTVLFNKVTEQGNSCFVQRLKMPGAKKSALRVYMDVLPDDIPTYERGIDNKHTLDVDGNKIPTGDTVPGYKIKWVTAPVPENEFGRAPTAIGSQVDGAGATSQLIPFLDLEVPDVGSYGDLVGFRLSNVNLESSPPVDSDVVSDQLTALYRLQLVERPNARSTPNVLENKYGEISVDFSIKKGAYNAKTRQHLYADERILPSYHDADNQDIPPYYGPFKKLHFYYSNIETILVDMFNKEKLYTNFDEGEGEEHQINILSGVHTDATPYESIQMVDGVDFNGYTTLYAVGGDDGDTSQEAFDLEVRRQAASFGDLDIKYLDLLRYPISVFYDSGFSIDTVEALGTMMSRRKDFIVVTATQDANQKPNLPSEETSLALAIASALRILPESELYGTPAYRAAVVGQCGILINSPYRGYLPLTIQLAIWFARYMGSGTGIWDSQNKPDVWPNNEVTDFKDVNIPYKPANARMNDWDNGLIWFQTSRNRTLFAPAMQTIYPDDTSIMNSLINGFIASHLQKIAVEVWREMTGRTDLTPNQFLERSDAKIADKARGMFDGRAIITPVTRFTGQDANNGYSWTTTIRMQAPNMKTVNFITIESDRLNDLT